MHTVIDNTTARRLFLDRHALAERPAGPARGAALADLVGRIGFVQVDSIATVERAQHMILFSRRSAYRPAALAPLIETDRALWEHWTHDASILPVGLFPHWKHRFARDAERLHLNWRRWFREGYEAQFDTILDRISRDGPVGSADVGEGEARGRGGWWDWHPSKTALEWLWRTGRLAITRREGFRKLYDLTERVIPDALLRAEVEEGATVDWAMSSALRQLGFGSVTELRAYWNAVTPAQAAAWAAAAVADGRALPVRVTGADGRLRPAFADPGLDPAAVPEPPRRMRVLSPFDPALRDRDRTEFLFGFHYRIEIYVPEPKRRYGYYVFPVLEGDRLVGRLDARAHRDVGELRLRAFWPEPGVRLTAAREASLRAELDRLARFSGCDRVVMLDGWARDPLSPG